MKRWKVKVFRISGRRYISVATAIKRFEKHLEDKIAPYHQPRMGEEEYQTLLLEQFKNYLDHLKKDLVVVLDE